LLDGFQTPELPLTRLHPADAAVLDRNTHHFDLRCLPIPFTGPLKTADIVLLFLSPGLNPFDLDHAMSAEGQAWHHRHRTGLEPLPGKVEHETAYSWRHRTLAHLGIDDAAAHKRLSIFLKFTGSCLYRGMANHGGMVG
jgi:hypothetical protein